MAPSEPDQRVVLVTGPSGAGRSTAIQSLEDLGFEVIDNIPLSFIPRLFEGAPLARPVALGIDVRNRDFSVGALGETIGALTRSSHVAPEVLYLHCQPEVLVRRYGETRRRHPLAPAEPPIAGIAREVDLLGAIRARADVLIDTTEMSPHDLRAEMARWFGGAAGGARLLVSLHSFSYKRGIPQGMDMVFDTRFLRNPHWVAALRSHDGRDPAVAAHVEGDPRFEEYFTRLCDLVRFMLPAQLDEGKSHWAIAFGCTGGQHRSVAVAEKLAAVLAQAGWQVSKRHRELERRAGYVPDKRQDEQT